MKEENERKVSIMRSEGIVEKDNKEIIRDIGWKRDKRIEWRMLSIIEGDEMKIVDGEKREELRKGEKNLNKVDRRNGMISIIEDSNIKIEIDVGDSKIGENWGMWRMEILKDLIDEWKEEIEEMERECIGEEEILIKKRMMEKRKGMIMRGRRIKR